MYNVDYKPALFLLVLLLVQKENFMNNPEEEFILQLHPRPHETVSLEIPKDTLESLKKIALSRDMSYEALLKFYIGQGLRQDLASSQECSNCGHKVKKPLSQRMHNCPVCHASLCRDLNAAINIKARGTHALKAQVMSS